MSHLTHVKNVFTRKDLLLQALSKFEVEVREPGRVRFYGRQSEAADIVAVLQHYDLGFRLQKVTATSTQHMLDESEDTLDFESTAARYAYTPVCDFWNGEVESRFGSNLCLLNAEYYSLLLTETQDVPCQARVEETEDKILVTIEI